MRIFPFSRFIVFDKSMVPSFLHGDHIITFNWVAPKKDDVVVFKRADKLLIKRIKEIHGLSYICTGDNGKYSKTNYKVATKDLIGKVILKY